jgi:hypothetical protein
MGNEWNWGRRTLCAWVAAGGEAVASRRGRDDFFKISDKLLFIMNLTRQHNKADPWRPSLTGFTAGWRRLVG